MFRKGHKKMGGKKKGTKNKITLLKEERRAIFDKKVSKKWEATIDKLKPEYVADQFMGKAQDNVNIRFFKPFKKIDELSGNNGLSENRENKKTD